MSSAMCPGIINASYDNDKLPPIRISLFLDCKRLSTLVMNSIITAIKRPYKLLFHNNTAERPNGQWLGVFGDLIHNRSDISISQQTVNYDRHQVMYNSPILGYTNVISILSGKIFDKSDNSFNMLGTFTLEMWTIYAILLLLVAIVSEVIHMKSVLRFLSVVRIGNNYFNLIMQFLRQPQEYFTRICCIKHYVINTSTLISITLMIIFFNTDYSSDLIRHPLLHINSIDDLALLIEKYPDVKIIFNKQGLSGVLLMQLIEWQGHQAELIKSKLEDVPIYKFNYEEVYNGQSVIIAHDRNFERMMKVNPELKFHVSSDRHYGSQSGLFYSKSIDINLKNKVDSICYAIFESGMLNSFRELRRRTIRLKFNDGSHSQEIFSMDFIEKRFQIFKLCFTTIIFLLLIEIIICKISFIASLVIFLSK